MRVENPIKILTSIYLSSFSSFQLMREMLNLFNQTSFTSIKKLQVFLEPQDFSTRVKALSVPVVQKGLVLHKNCLIIYFLEVEAT